MNITVQSISKKYIVNKHIDSVEIKIISTESICLFTRKILIIMYVKWGQI